MQDFILFLKNHGQLSITFIGLMMALFIVEMIRQKRGAYQVSTQQLTHMINHQNAKVVDIRSHDEYKSGHIIDSISLPLSEFHSSKKLDKAKGPIVLVCAKGVESLKLANQLKNQGWDIHILGGGISSWVNAELPLVKD